LSSPPALKSPLRERWYVVAIAAVLVLAGVGYLIFRVTDDPDTPDAKRLPIAPQLDTGGLALATLLTDARDESYHATYRSTADAKVSGGTVAIEIWNTDGKSRVNTTLHTTDNEVVHTASIVRDGKTVVCEQKPKSDWECSNAPKAPVGDASGLVASIQAQLQNRSVVERAEKVGDRDARCFSVSSSPTAEPLDVCVDKKGVLLRLKSSAASIELVSLDTSTPDSAFDLPAAVKS
jgi:hypothetical protein